MMSEPSADDGSAVIIDNGTGTLRAGYNGDDYPSLVWPNVIGQPQSETQKWALDLKDSYVGEEAQKMRGRLAVQYPMEGGVVKNWEHMEEIWGGVFHQLKADPSEKSVLMSDRPFIPKQHREKMTETMFESFNTSWFYVMNQAVLDMFGMGRGYTVVVDCGEGACTIMPIEELNIRPHAILKGDVTGADLTSHLQSLMLERSYDVTGQAGLEAAREAKESLCFVAQDYDQELNAAQNSCSLQHRHELPGGQLVTLNEERIRVPEALFKPYLLGKCGDGIHELVYRSIMKCDIDSRRHFYCNIMPVGGAPCIPGFNERLQKEVAALAPSTMRIKVVNCVERLVTTFIGGSILSSLSVFQKCWVTKQEYEEHGPTIVHRKCT